METTIIRAHLHQFIDSADDNQIEAIYTLLEEKVEAIQGANLKQYNQEIEEAEARIDSGAFYNHEEIAKMSK